MDHCVILNKGPELDLENEIFLPNIGRESHSYLWYIITNYDTLPDIVVFTQADISDHHCGNNMTGYLSCLDTIRKLASSLGKPPPRVMRNYLHHSDAKSLNWDPEFNLNPRWQRIITTQGITGYKNDDVVTYEAWYKQHIHPVYPNPTYIYPNALFAVHKRLITYRPVEYYQNLLEQVDHHVHPVEAHFMERAWYHIFSTIE